MPKNCYECGTFGISDVVGLECPWENYPEAYDYEKRPDECPLFDIKMEDLKPCPFCGDMFAKIIEKDIDLQLKVEKRYCVGCDTEGCFGNRKFSRMFKTKEEAIEAWNKRVYRRENYEHSYDRNAEGISNG
jgi:Lar family restriction alleviation protein